MQQYDFNKKEDFKKFRKSILEILDPIKEVKRNNPLFKQFQGPDSRTEAGRMLPEYYLVYFLFVDLLGYEDIVLMEKTAWSVKVEYNGIPFAIEHRKFGLGIFGNPDNEKEAEEIAKRIRWAVSKAAPYFEYLATSAAEHSKLNVHNRSRELFAHYDFFLSRYKDSLTNIEKYKGKKVVKKGKNWKRTSFPVIQYYNEASWNAMAVIDAFFSWTEHVFIHIAILKGALKTGVEVADLAKAEWSAKFKKAVSLGSVEMKTLYDELTDMRRQVRNFLDHGSFGKDGEAFSFHSGAGAVPLLLPHKRGKPRFTFQGGLSFKDQDAINTIERFLKILWTGKLRPAKIYIQDHGLPAILTMVTDGQYETAMQSVRSMQGLAEYMMHLIDRSADMDF